MIVTRDMTDGDTPFGTWGWPGVGFWDLRVLYQERWWVDRCKRPHLVAEMSDAYRSNVVGFLLRDVVASWAEQGAPHHPGGPVGWLEDTALMRRLRDLTPDAPAFADAFLRSALGRDGRP